MEMVDTAVKEEINISSVAGRGSIIGNPAVTKTISLPHVDFIMAHLLQSI